MLTFPVWCLLASRRRSRRGTTLTGIAALSAALVLFAACARIGPEENEAAATSGAEGLSSAGSPFRVGQDPVPAAAIHVAENHSDALVQWALAGVRNRILVHVDGHIDFDWVPDATVETIRRAVLAQDEPALRDLEVHPWDLTAKANGGFGIWNFLYPAARTGLVREILWVVPDGTLPDEAAATRLRRSYAATLSGVTIEEIEGLRLVNGVIAGHLCGVPFRICERARLPRLDEPVLLDIDLDWFTTRSALEPHVGIAPRPAADDLFSSLAAAGLTADLVTVSWSTCGGYLPYEARSVGEDVLLALREPERFRSAAEVDRRRRRGEALAALEENRGREAVRRLSELVAEAPENSSLHAALGEALRLSGPLDEAPSEEAEASRLDHAAAWLELYRGDSDRQNNRPAAALDHFERFVARASGAITPASEGPDPVLYARRRVAFCQLAAGRNAEAAEGFRRILRNRPDHADTQFSLADALAGLGDLPGAIAAQREACRLRRDDPRYSWKLGSLLLAARDPVAAEGPLRRGGEGRPSSAAGRYNLAVCLASLGRLDEALAEAETAVRLEPGTPGFTDLVEKIRAAKSRTTATFR